MTLDESWELCELIARKINGDICTESIFVRYVHYNKKIEGFVIPITLDGLFRCISDYHLWKRKLERRDTALPISLVYQHLLHINYGVLKYMIQNTTNCDVVPRNIGLVQSRYQRDRRNTAIPDDILEYIKEPIARLVVLNEYRHILESAAKGFNISYHPDSLSVHAIIFGSLKDILLIKNKIKLMDYRVFSERADPELVDGIYL